MLRTANSRSVGTVVPVPCSCIPWVTYWGCACSGSCRTYRTRGRGLSTLPSKQQVPRPGARTALPRCPSEHLQSCSAPGAARSMAPSGPTGDALSERYTLLCMHLVPEQGNFSSCKMFLQLQTQQGPSSVTEKPNFKNRFKHLQ